MSTLTPLFPKINTQSDPAMAFPLVSREFPTFLSTRRGESVPNFASRQNPNPQFCSLRPILRRDEGFRVGVRLSGAKVRDVDVVGLLEELDVVSSYGQFEVQVKDDRKGDEEKREEKDDYYVNMGHGIRTLREDFPALFYRELNFDIYREDIVFKDPVNTFMGIDKYKSIFWGLRFHGRIFFRALWIDIISVWQPVENVLMVRWTVHGVPRVPWESRGRFDGTSLYKFDKQGKIFEHRVDNIALNSPPKFKVPSLGELIESLGCPSNANPTYFEGSSSSSSPKK